LSVMLPSSSRNPSKGFTLLELLIALALLGVLAGALYGTYFSLIKGRESANEGMEARRELRTTLDLLRREISSTLYSRNNERLHFSVEDRDIFGKPASVLFFTSLATPQPSGQVVSDQVDLRYEILERDKKMILSRQAKDLYHSGEAVRYPQMESIEGFLVECKNGDKWVKSWDTAINKGLPKAVRITVTVKDGEKTAEYTLLAAPRMTQ
jgi:general secretion pathway protein J